MKSETHYWHLGWTKDIRGEEKSARPYITSSTANGDKLETTKPGVNVTKFSSNLPSYSIPTPDLWISCSLFRMENGDWANFPQAFLTINQQRDAHLHTLSWWLSAIFQNSVVRPGCSHLSQPLEMHEGKRACPTRLVRMLPNLLGCLLMKFTSQVFKAPKTSPAKPARVKNTKKMTYIHNLAKT